MDVYYATTIGLLLGMSTLLSTSVVLRRQYRIVRWSRSYLAVRWCTGRRAECSKGPIDDGNERRAVQKERNEKEKGRRPREGKA